jgi:hypothetical protein
MELDVWKGIGMDGPRRLLMVVGKVEKALKEGEDMSDGGGRYGSRTLGVGNCAESRIVAKVVVVLVVRVLLGWRKEPKGEITELFIKAENRSVLQVPFMLVRLLMLPLKLVFRMLEISLDSLVLLTLMFPFSLSPPFPYQPNHHQIIITEQFNHYKQGIAL